MEAGQAPAETTAEWAALVAAMILAAGLCGCTSTPPRT